jgi:hypothetical protein
MIGSMVHPIEETRATLTVEIDGVGHPSDLEGNAVHILKGRELFIDSLTSMPIVRVTADEAKKLRAEGTVVANATGNVTGHFIEAPDGTKFGILGSKKKVKAA